VLAGDEPDAAAGEVQRGVVDLAAWPWFLGLGLRADAMYRPVAWTAVGRLRPPVSAVKSTMRSRRGRECAAPSANAAVLAAAADIASVTATRA
jgi:hypothetical protein